MSALIFLCAILIGFVIYSLISSVRRPKNFPPGETMFMFPEGYVQNCSFSLEILK